MTFIHDQFGCGTEGGVHKLQTTIEKLIIDDSQRVRYEDRGPLVLCSYCID